MSATEMSTADPGATAYPDPLDGRPSTTGSSLSARSPPSVAGRPNSAPGGTPGRVSTVTVRPPTS